MNDHPDPEPDLDDGLLDEEEDDTEAYGVSWWRPLTGVALAVWSLLGLAASLMLAIDKVRLLENPDFVPSCNFSPLLSCSSVMLSDQAAAFGFPNPYLGLVGFSIILTLAVLVLLGERLPTPVLLGGAVGSLLGTAFVHWLIFQSLYRISALCPWCMVVWVVTVPIALWFTLAALDRVGNDAVRRVVAVLHDWRFTLLALWYIGVALLILIRFWDYWSSLV